MSSRNLKMVQLHLLIVKLLIAFNLGLIECQSYSKVCSSAIITNIAEAKALKGCQTIDGFLEIKEFNVPSALLVLEQYLSSIEYIEGYLKITGNNEVWSLKFLSNLKRIVGLPLESNKYSIVLSKNQKLLSLWQNNQTVKTDRGEVFIHYNPRLCYSEIEKCFGNSFLTELELNTTFITNGFARNCNSTLINWPIKLLNITTNSAEFYWEEVFNNVEVVKKYAVYYKVLIDLEDFRMVNRWNKQEFNNTEHTFIRNIERIFTLKDLIPNSEYLFYVQVTHSQPILTEDRSEYSYFKTKASLPGRVQNLKIQSRSSTTIVSSLYSCNKSLKIKLITIVECKLVCSKKR